MYSGVVLMIVSQLSPLVFILLPLQLMLLLDSLPLALLFQLNLALEIPVSLET